MIYETAGSGVLFISDGCPERGEPAVVWRVHILADTSPDIIRTIKTPDFDDPRFGIGRKWAGLQGTSDYLWRVNLSFSNGLILPENVDAALSILPEAFEQVARDRDVEKAMAKLMMVCHRVEWPVYRLGW